MTTEVCDIIESEEEDVVLQGSELHAVLTNLGFSDFESAPVYRIEYSDPELNSDYFWTKIRLPSNEKIYNSICNYISCMTQDNKYLDEQLRIISQLDCLLDDHITKIKSFIDKKKQNFWKRALLWIPLLGSFATIVIYGVKREHKSILNFALASSILSLIAQRKYLQWTSNRNLKCLVFLQNELYYSYKKSFKILRYSFRMRLDSRKSGQKFIELEKSKQMYLQPLTEILVSSLENVSFTYYLASKILLKLLPHSYSCDDLITAFENNSFSLKGEVTYQTLKKLYYTYLLAQSEMIHLLAIAYNRDTWKNDGTLPEMKLSYIISYLTRVLRKHHFKLLIILNEYSSKKFVPEHKEYKGLKSSKWQDLYVHLDLTAYKIQTAYKVILSTLEEIDSYEDADLNKDFSDIVMQNLNEIYKQIDSARSFTEFSSLLATKAQHEQFKEYNFKENKPDFQNPNSELHIILDSEPQIVDEVFEEYIKEEYFKPLYEDGDESIAQSYKFDKLLAKNFMSELKEALLEKHKSMSERESKALQRMYKNITQEVVSKQSDNSSFEIARKDPSSTTIPFNPSVSLNVENGLKYEQKLQVHQSSEHITSENMIEDTNLANKNNFETLKDSRGKHALSKSVYQDEDQVYEEANLQRFSLIGCKSNMQFPPFLKASEETFIGDGENSEEELVESECENDET